MYKTIALFGLLLGVFCATPAFAARTILYYENECCRYITEGEFAVLYVQGLRLSQPAQGWNEQSAAAALSALGHQPVNGWILSRFLSEAVMSRVLKNSHFYRKPFSDPEFQKSDKLVTISNARHVVPGDDKLTQGEFAILLADALNLRSTASEWTADKAIEALSSQPVPIRPLKGGWKANTLLDERVMKGILANTPYRPEEIDFPMPVTTLRAYSLLFGSEIATEGLFGMYVVSVLTLNGLIEPKKGSEWNPDSALRYIKTTFNVDNEYGWYPEAPLCKDLVYRTLLKIVEVLQKQAVPAGKNGNKTSGIFKEKSIPIMNFAAKLAMGYNSYAEAIQSQSLDKNSEIINNLNTIRNVFGAGDMCGTVRIRDLIGLAKPETPLCYECVNPASPAAPPQ